MPYVSYHWHNLAQIQKRREHSFLFDRYFSCCNVVYVGQPGVGGQNIPEHYVVHNVRDAYIAKELALVFFKRMYVGEYTLHRPCDRCLHIALWR